eukprot:13196_1
MSINSKCYTIIQTFIVCVCVTLSQWIELPSLRLPYKMDEFAFGLYNDTVFVLGGFGDSWVRDFIRRQQSHYSLKTMTRTFYNSSALPTDVICGDSRCSTYQGEMLYIVQTDVLHIFNMRTKQFTANWNGLEGFEVSTNTVHTDTACVTSTAEYLIFLGGCKTENCFDIYDIYLTDFRLMSFSTFTWIRNAPDFDLVRTHAECITHNDKLWIFGGRSIATNPNYGYSLATNQYIDISVVTNNMAANWMYTAPLSTPLYSINAIGVGDLIYLVSGNNDIVHILNTTNHSMTFISPANMVQVTGDAGIVLHHSNTHVFGGSDNNNVWQYYNLNSTAVDASINITTKGPTYHPSYYPSYNPSYPPSSHPSYTPITGHPSSFPSAVPSFYPSSNTQNTTPPTTANPTFQSPTSHPTSSTGEPSSTPTVYPTLAPILQTIAPSFTSTRLPTSPTGRSDAITTMYTISITFPNCGKEDAINACDINKTTMANQIVAYIDYDTSILSTDIINNEVVVIVSITMDEYNSLIGETISDRIENELERTYGDDIDVIVKRTDDANDTGPTKENDSLGVIVSVVIGMVILISFATILYRRHKRKHVLIQNNQSMVQKELEQDAKVANNNSINEVEQMDDKEDSIESLYANRNDKSGRRTTGDDQLRSMSDALNKVPLDLLVTKRDIETIGVEEREGEKKGHMNNDKQVEMEYTQEGVDKNTVMNSTEFGTTSGQGNADVIKQTSKGDAMDNI